MRRGVGRRQDAKMKYFRQTEERHATDFSRICTLGVYSVRAKVPQARREKKKMLADKRNFCLSPRLAKFHQPEQEAL